MMMVIVIVIMMTQYLPITLAAPNVAFLALCWLLPESPVWLVRRGREAEARWAVTSPQQDKADGPYLGKLWCGSGERSMT